MPLDLDRDHLPQTSPSYLTLPLKTLFIHFMLVLPFNNALPT
jgi:hypothetical protein